MTAHFRRIRPAVFVLLAALPPVGLQAGVGQWTSNGPEGGFVETLAVHPSHPSIVYAATFRHLYKSVDAGASWVPTGLPGGTNLVLPTSDPTVVYATAQPGGSFWVFHTGLTDLEYTLTVTDQVAGVVRTYAGGATDGTRLCGAADTAAFRN